MQRTALPPRRRRCVADQLAGQSEATQTSLLIPNQLTRTALERNAKTRNIKPPWGTAYAQPCRPQAVVRSPKAATTDTGSLGLPWEKTTLCQPGENRGGGPEGKTPACALGKMMHSSGAQIGRGDQHNSAARCGCAHIPCQDPGRLMEMHTNKINIVEVDVGRALAQGSITSQPPAAK